MEANAKVLEHLHHAKDRGDAALGIDRTPAPDGAIRDVAVKWRMGPGFGLTGGNRVDVAVEREGAARAAAFDGTDEIGTAGQGVPEVGCCAECLEVRRD